MTAPRESLGTAFTGAPEGAEAFLQRLHDDIRHNRLVLPSLPDVARRVRDAVEDPNARAERVARVLGTDAAMSARLLKVANSPLYRRPGPPIEEVRMAVTRLGLPLVRTLIVNLSIVQVMRPSAGAAGAHLRAIFQHSVQVAAWAYALAERCTRINPQEAVLAGMVHDIGYLPLLQYAAYHRIPLLESADLDAVLHRHHAEVGAMVLDTWGFGDRLKEVVRQHENVYRTGRAEIAPVDVIIVAELCAGHENAPARPPIDPGRVPALARLGLANLAAARGDPEIVQRVAYAERMLRL